MKRTLPSTIGHKVKAGLLDRLRTLPVGSRLTPERRLAEEYQVSRSTMSKILTELVNEGYLARKVGSGTYVSPRNTEVLPSRLPSQNSGELLVAYPDFFSYEFWHTVHVPFHIPPQKMSPDTLCRSHVPLQMPQSPDPGDVFFLPPCPWRLLRRT